MPGARSSWYQNPGSTNRADGGENDFSSSSGGGRPDCGHFIASICRVPDLQGSSRLLECTNCAVECQTSEIGICDKLEWRDKRSFRQDSRQPSWADYRCQASLIRISIYVLTRELY